MEHRVNFSRAVTPPDVVTVFDARTGALDQTLKGPENSMPQQEWQKLFSRLPVGAQQWVIKEAEIVDPTRTNGRIVLLPYVSEDAAITSDNKWAATLNSGTLYLWPLDPARVLNKACKSFIARNLTAEESENFRIPEKYRVPACPNLAAPTPTGSEFSAYR